MTRVGVYSKLVKAAVQEQEVLDWQQRMRKLTRSSSLRSTSRGSIMGAAPQQACAHAPIAGHPTNHAFAFRAAHS